MKLTKTLLFIPLVLAGCQLTPKPVVAEAEPKPLPIEERGIDELCNIRMNDDIVTKHAMKVLNFDLVVAKITSRNVVYAYSLVQAERHEKLKESRFYEMRFNYRTAIFDMPKDVTLKEGDLINLTGVDEDTHYSGCKFEISNKWPIKIVKKGVFEYVPKD